MSQDPWSDTFTGFSVSGSDVVVSEARGPQDLAALHARFCGLLRLAGLLIGPSEMARFATAVSDLNPATVRELRWIARITLTNTEQQRTVLDAVFDQVFLGRIDDASRGDSRAPLLPSGIEPGQKAPKSRDAAEVPNTPSGRLGRSGDQAESGSEDDEQESNSESVSMTTSAEERLRKKDFGSCSSAELVQLAGLIAGLKLQPPVRRSHRLRRGTYGSHHDLRRTLRASRRTAGDPIFLARKVLVDRPRRVVLLADVSGSMERYSRAYLYLMHAAVRALEAEAFTFATQLTRSTSVLRHHSPEVALHRAAQAADDWSGGTRIGVAVQSFLDGWGRRGLARGAVIVIISDGWESGDAGLLGEQMARLSRLAHRIIWVNPRKQQADYQPLVAGMVAALPTIDTFISGHSYEAMREVIAAISADRTTTRR